MGHAAGRQFQALLWKNWLCRLRQPVLSLAEFLWPCILFMILTVLRFQEPPRHRDSCYLRPRDLPSRGVFPFVQGLLCNTGSRCSNVSYTGSAKHSFRSSRFQTAADHNKVDDLDFLEELQDFADEICETVEKAKHLQKLWVERSKAPGSSYGTSFLTVDLNKTEEVISKLERLHQQPHIWDFLLLLPRLYANNVHVDDRIRVVVPFLQAVLNSLTSLEDLDWLPLNHTYSKASEAVLNVTISTLMFLQEHGVVVTESGYNLSLQKMVWDPQKVQSDLKSQFGFDDLHSEQILNYSAELKEIPTDSSLEWMVCSVLSSISENETDGEGLSGDCPLQWTEAKEYIIHAVSWPHVYTQVFKQWQKSNLLHKILTGTEHSLETLRDQSEEGSEPWHVAEVLNTVLHLLNDSLTADGLNDNMLPHLLKLQRVLQNLPQWPVVQRLLQFDGAFRNALAQNLHFIQEVFFRLETSANDSELDGSGQLQLEMDMFFWQLKQMLMKNVSNVCRNGHFSEKEALLFPPNSRVWERLVGQLCHQNSSSATEIFNKLIGSVEDADHLLQGVIAGHTNMPVSLPEEYLDWQELEAQLLETSISCARVFRLPGADTSPEKAESSGGCKDQLISTVLFHTLDKAQLFLEQTDHWKAFIGLIRKTCEVARYLNMQGSLQKDLFTFSEDSPCYKENMDWKIISYNYLVFLNNLFKSPMASISRVLNATKDLLMMENKSHTLEDEQMNFLLSFVEFWEKLFLLNPLDSSSFPQFHNLSSLTETFQNASILWINHFKTSERDPSAADTQKLLEFGKEVIKRIQTLASLWIKKESRNIWRFMELILFEINPKLLELWMHGISKGERTKLEMLSTLLNFSVPENERVIRKSFNFSQFHSDWPKLTAVNMDFVHLSETIINSSYEFGFLRQEQVSEALDTVYALRNVSDLFSALSEPHKQEVDKILTHIYLNVFKDKDSALLLKIYSSFYQYIYKFFLNIQNRESLLTFLTQISKHILDIIKQFNFQTISNAFVFLSETVEFLDRISEVSYCQQLLSIFNFLELQAQSLTSTGDPELKMVHAALTGLKQLLIVDEYLRISFVQYMSQLFNGSVEALFDNECFAWDNESISSIHYSTDGESSFILPWTQFLSNLSADGSMFNEVMAIHCTVSWLQMWMEIWGSLSQILKIDMNIFSSLNLGLSQILEELENDVKISKHCQGMFTTYHPARLILNLIKNLIPAAGVHDWNDFLDLSDLWVALGDTLFTVKSLTLDKVNKSLLTLESALHQLKTFPLNTNTSREFFYSLLELFMELSNTAEYTDVYLINPFLLNNLTNYGAEFESFITELREAILFLRTVSHDQDLLSCADVFQKVTKLVLEGDLLYENASQRTLYILTMLTSTFFSENIISRLKGCVAWIDSINHLYVMFNSSFSQAHLQGILGSFGDIENKIDTTLKLVTWMLNMKEPLCSLNKSYINCVDIYLKNITDFLNVILTEVFEKENVPKFEILLTLLNDSTDQIRMTINSLTRDFDFASQSNWKHFTELILRPINMSEQLPHQFQNIWLHLIALGKEIQKLVKDISPNILEDNSSFETEKFLSVIATSPKEKDVNSLSSSVYHLASYLTFNLSQDLQNSTKIIPHEIMKAVGLGIQLVRDVFNFLMPTVHHNIPQNAGDIQVLKKVTSLMHTLKKTDIDLLVDQLEQISGSLMDFFKNISGLEDGKLGINLLVSLVEKFAESSHSWNVNHLLKLSRLFPKDDVNAVVDAYYVLPHVVRLLQRVLDKNFTEALKDVYNFTLLHGIRISNVTKEDFALAIKTLLDIIEFMSHKPGFVSEALTCLPEVWCWNYITSRFQQNPNLETCNVHKLIHSSFYSKVAAILDHLHLSPPGDYSQCSNESSRMEITRNVVCVLHELVDWNSILLEMCEVFHIKTSLLNTVQEFWHTVSPYVLSSGNLSNDSISELCMAGPIKQVALQIIETLKSVNYTKVTSGENIFDKLTSLSKILNTDEVTETSVPSNTFLNLERIVKLISGVLSSENSPPFLISPLMLFLNANLTGNSLEALSSSIKKREDTYNIEEPWLEFEQIMKKLRHVFSIGDFFSAINQEIQTINSVSLQNATLQLVQFLESLNSSSLKTLGIVEDFLITTRNWFHEYANKNHSRMIQTLLFLMTNESLIDGVNLLAKDITTYLDYLKNISREGYFDVSLLTHLVNQEQLTNFSFVPLLFESILMNAINNLAGRSQETAPNLSNADLQIMDFINLTLNHTQLENGEEITFPPRSIVGFVEQLLKTFFSVTLEENSENNISFLLKVFHKDIIAEMSVVEMCRVFQQTVEPSEVLVTLQKTKMTVLHVLVFFAENPSLAKDLLCATMSCKEGGIRHLILSLIQGVTLVHGRYQEIKKIWSAPIDLDCESLGRNLSHTLENFKSNLETATAEDCECQPMLHTIQQRIRMLTKSLQETFSSGNPIVNLLSNFTVTEDVKVKDLMKNITKLTQELRSSIHISDGTINSILEAHISHSKVLFSALAMALSGRCDEEVLRLLLTFPEDGASFFATEELCALPGSRVYPLILLMSRNLNLRNFIYKTLIPSEANGLLNSLLDVISRLNSIVAQAQHILEYLPEFLQVFKITALLDMPATQKISQNGQARSSAFGSFQSVMKMLCKEEASFLSDSNTFINLPRVINLLEDDQEKFSIPEDSTPFCLKLYQEILQIPNGALVWAFLKPVLHGKILYTPNTPEISKIIQKANYTFDFVDKIKTLSETLLKMSSDFQGSGNVQMLSQLQEALRNKFIRHFIESQLHTDVDKLTEKLQNYGGMLDEMFHRLGAGHLQFLGRILVNLSSCIMLNRFLALDSVELLETKAYDLMKQNDFLASIIFNSSSVNKNYRSESLRLPPHVTYTIRTSTLYSMRTDMVKNPSWKFHPQSLPADGFKYNYVFVPLQDMIERAIVLLQTGKEALEPTVQAQGIPYPCHTRDLFLNNVGFFFPLIMMLTWMVSVASMVRKLVYEREIQIEEYLRMMGVHPVVHFLAWFLENMAMLTLSSATLATILKASGIFTHSNAIIIFLFFLDFGVSVVMLSYFLSAFFSQANTAALCTSLAYMISFLPYIILLVLHNQLSFVIQTFLCFLSTTAFGQGVYFITFLEGQEAGIQWNNMYQSPQQGDMTFGWVCWMILFDSSLYFLCGWYFSNLIPGTFGLRKPWYFPFTTSYWKNICGVVERKQSYMTSNLFFVNENVVKKGTLPQNEEGDLEGGLPGVSLVSVTKVYEDNRAAVKNLTLTFHRDQITALLGTNGAGKTTIISMLTGLYPPTSGTIFINGKNLQTDMASIRRELGVCPQQDVLFDNLTVLEHLLLFASIKEPRWTMKELHQQINKTLQDVELTQHQHKQIRALSGGMKRKLSIGIAFLGTSRTVVLDEPTSGVDPCSRRSIWDILLKYREGHTVIFTTHHLDEAEVLSDRVAVLQRGQLRCCGPPFCLKEAYGQGLSLTLTKQPSVMETHDPKDVARITSLIQLYIPQAFLKDNSGRELTFTIPKDADKACFKGLFQALDENLHHLHLTGYGISDTTLEEVFLMLLQDSQKKSQFATGTEVETQYHETLGHPAAYHDCSLRPPPLQGGPLLRSQTAAVLGKRLRHTLRSWRGTLSHLLLPMLFVALAMGLFMVRPLAVEFPPLKLTPGHYERAETYFFSSESDDMDLASVLLRKFEDQDLLCDNLNSDPKNSSCWHTDPFPHSGFQSSCGCLKCANGSARASYLKNGLGHTLLNLSAFSVEEYLLLPSEKPRLGGWSFGVQTSDQAQDANSNVSKPKTLAKVWYNQKGFHSLPSYLNHLNNLILWRHLPSSVDWRQYGITLYSHPYGGALLNEDKILESIRQCGVALCIVLGFSILTASIGSYVVKDRVSGAKRLQHLSGLGYRTYWFTNFLYDMLFYLVSVCLCVAIIVAFQLTAFTFRENLAATALLLALFGYATIPWMYLMSRIFSSSDVAFISHISLNFIFGLCTMLMTIMPRLLAIISKAQNLQNIYDILKWAFTIFPQFCLGQGLIELCYNQIRYDLTHNFGIDPYVSPFEMNFLGWIFVELALQGTVLLLVRILLHGDLLLQLRGHSTPRDTVKSSKDTDVEKEQVRVLEGRTSGDILVLHNLSKSYQGLFKRTTAVQDISLGIPRGECFGLLGVNGAGKSTTFKMLTGDILPTSGHAIIRIPTGEKVALSSPGKAGVLIGYCPQQDALDELLSGWEHLHYYCNLRGIPKQCIPEVAGDLVKHLHLEAHADKLVGTYSGGTKRKLSTALALVGKPQILLLDEPSSGMDPCSKRYLWKTITQEVQEGCAAVLTSHSMEECEALCTRLAIMVNGSFKCLGSPQHIKNRFGDGYTVKIWLCKEANQHSVISDCLKLNFPGIQFKGQHLNLLEYHVPKRWGCLADLFKVLENNKTVLNIKHYSINQTTLEQIFINFATEQQQTPQSTLEPSVDCHHLHHLPI
ncbi:ATP-binding cassette sub-family A member 13 [Choloepus didactylus]|uniref:ATP-binding cassette sub-family A member 13 n=1 Tax=Choloepus didactylus TaxID=27675 RepID=UPI00189D61B7|nr:ATP-binding cassette sub-family A member 13 [Choloepus didactylus]